MTDAVLAPACDFIKAQEGLRLEAYPDPISKGPPWTIGYGRADAGVKLGMTCTEEEATAWLEATVEILAERFDRAFPWWREMTQGRQVVLLSMGYQLGLAGLLGFTNTLQAMKAGNYAAAAHGMINSQWADQTPNRAQLEANIMASGVMPDEQCA
jgi:lysozyme